MNDNVENFVQDEMKGKMSKIQVLIKEVNFYFVSLLKTMCCPFNDPYNTYKIQIIDLYLIK